MGLRMSPNDKSKRRLLGQLDESLPEEIDRRRFFKGAVGAIAGSALAGCAGGGGQEGTPTPKVKTKVKTVVKTKTQEEEQDLLGGAWTWRQAWKPEPNSAVAFIAALRGFWREAGVVPPQVVQGFGSGDTTRRIATDTEHFGRAAIPPILTAIARGRPVRIYGVDKAINQFALFWPKKWGSGSGDALANKTIGAQSSLAVQAWPLYKEQFNVPDSAKVKFVKEASDVALYQQGDIDALWGFLNDAPRYFSAIGQENLGVSTLYSKLPSYGEPLIVNQSFAQNNKEYMSRLLTGYSAAGKWTLLNPVKAVEIMRNDVAAHTLKAVEKDLLVAQIKSGLIAPNLSDGIKNNGYGYLNRTVLENSLTKLAPALGINNPPSVETASLFDIQKNATLSQFSSSEWETVKKNAEPYTRFVTG